MTPTYYSSINPRSFSSCRELFQDNTPIAVNYLLGFNNFFCLRDPKMLIFTRYKHYLNLICCMLPDNLSPVKSHFKCYQSLIIKHFYIF